MRKEIGEISARATTRIYELCDVGFVNVGMHKRIEADKEEAELMHLKNKMDLCIVQRWTREGGAHASMRQQQNRFISYATLDISRKFV